MTDHPNEPTADQCSGNARLPDFGGHPVYACWYPKMGGYNGRAAVVVDGVGCFDVYVWHDGDFPFTGQASDDRSPTRLHHCAAKQFVEFGQSVLRLQGAAVVQGLQEGSTGEPKHTPGPWVYDPDCAAYGMQSPFMVWTSKGPGHGTVATTNACGLMPTDPDRQAADARLIAATPDLLDVCERLDEIDCCDGYELNDSGYQILWDALNMARNALAKARWQ